MLHSRGNLLLMLDADGATKITDLEKLESKVCFNFIFVICDPHYIQINIPPPRQLLWQRNKLSLHYTMIGIWKCLKHQLLLLDLVHILKRKLLQRLFLSFLCKMKSHLNFLLFYYSYSLTFSLFFQRKWYRNFLMKGFHLVVLLTAGPDIRDTQVIIYFCPTYFVSGLLPC